MNTKTKITTINDLRQRLTQAEKVNSELTADATLAEKQQARESVRKAREALRIFCYRSKPAITASGHVLRH